MTLEQMQTLKVGEWVWDRCKQRDMEVIEVRLPSKYDAEGSVRFRWIETRTMYVRESTAQDLIKREQQ